MNMLFSRTLCNNVWKNLVFWQYFVICLVSVSFFDLMTFAYFFSLCLFKNWICIELVIRKFWRKKIVWKYMENRSSDSRLRLQLRLLHTHHYEKHSVYIQRREWCHSTYCISHIDAFNAIPRCKRLGRFRNSCRTFFSSYILEHRIFNL